MASNGDTDREFKVGADMVRGLGSFHKTLPHNDYGEVVEAAFVEFVQATRGQTTFQEVDAGGNAPRAGTFTNPQAGLAHDRLHSHPSTYDMPPAPTVTSDTTAAEMTELYWMAFLRDVPFDGFEDDPGVAEAAAEINERFAQAVDDDGDDPGHFILGVDVPGSATELAEVTPQNVFRMGLPGEEAGPLLSQFWLRNVGFGTQTIDQRQRPYAKGMNYLTDFATWLDAQNSGYGPDGRDYRGSNDAEESYYEPVKQTRYVATMRDLARFVNKDALHQAYFNAALILLNGKAKWTPGNPYSDDHAESLAPREAGFGTLGGPHLLALVSEVATRALKVVWNQKWQVHLRLRPEAYGGLVHVKKIGADVDGTLTKRPYKLPAWVMSTEAAKCVRKMNGTLLLPMAFTAGSPTHPAYGAGHATVAGACVTVLKAYFKLYERDGDDTGDGPITNIFPIDDLVELPFPYSGPPANFPLKTYTSTVIENVPVGTTADNRVEIDAGEMTIEGELNKLAANVAMGRTMGGVHWRTDNTRSLTLGEALAARILADITVDVNERPVFEFRTFSRKADGEPKVVRIREGRIYVDGVQVDSNASAL